MFATVLYNRTWGGKVGGIPKTELNEEEGMRIRAEVIGWFFLLLLPHLFTLHVLFR